MLRSSSADSGPCWHQRNCLLIPLSLSALINTTRIFASCPLHHSRCCWAEVKYRLVFSACTHILDALVYPKPTWHSNTSRPPCSRAYIHCALPPFPSNVSHQEPRPPLTISLPPSPPPTPSSSWLWSVQRQRLLFQCLHNNCRSRMKNTKKNYLWHLLMNFIGQPEWLQLSTSSPPTSLRNPSPQLPLVLTILVQVPFRQRRILPHGFPLTLRTLIPLSSRFLWLILRALSFPVASMYDRHPFSLTSRRKREVTNMMVARPQYSQVVLCSADVRLLPSQPLCCLIIPPIQMGYRLSLVLHLSPCSPFISLASC